ncbi:MAG: DUF1549 domain-containing protein [Fimbriiglobus sp.]
MRTFCLVGLLFAAGWCSAADEKPVKLNVAPTTIQLAGARDRQGVVVQAEYADGHTRDVTNVAEFRFDAPLATAVDGFVAPKTEGTTSLTVSFGSLKSVIPVTVKKPAEAEPLGFRKDILPVFTKVGCNAGKCHGSASGKDGFRLSLYGFDPDGDHFRLTRERSGRQINLDTPADSLLVNKATGKVPHTGGERIKPDSEYYAMLMQWLERGAEKDSPDAAKPTGIEVYPTKAVFSTKGEKQRIVVRAKYSDGTDRDVTRFAVFVGNNDSSATVSENGWITSTGPGEAFLLARFDEFTSGTAAIVRSGSSFADPKTTPLNDLDKHVLAKLNRLHVAPSDVCTDEQFVRRVYLDLIGLPPTPSERLQFLTDPAQNKREKLVDQLLQREEFLDIWAMKYAEMLQIRTVNGISFKGLQLYEKWLRDKVKAGATIDQIVKEVLSSVGGTFENPPVNYYQTETSPQLLAENVAQVFLGTRIQCAQCHNHPFDRWTMDDYYGFASFFSQLGYKNAQDPRELTVFNSGTGSVRHPLGDREVKPKFLGGDTPTIAKGVDYRAVLAEWLTSPKNSAFAENFGNVVWAHFFGRGVVEPVDDIRISNPSSNPELLEALGKKAVEYKFDVKKIARDICLSRSYQQSTKRNDSNQYDERNFARQSVRRLRAEVMLDSINTVTETSTSFSGQPLGGRATQLPDGRSNNYFLMTFGRSSRATACSCEVKTSPTLSQALHLINGENTNTKIIEGKLVERMLAASVQTELVVEELYLRCLSRKPTNLEMEKIRARLAKSTDPKKSLEDLFWALLNSNEFLFNH